VGVEEGKKGGELRVIRRNNNLFRGTRSDLTTSQKEKERNPKKKSKKKSMGSTRKLVSRVGGAFRGGSTF